MGLQLPPSIKRLLPFQSHVVTVGGFQMHYLDEGEGAAVVLLHGNPTWCFFYRNLIKVLKKNFRVIAPDFIGCGLSDHPTDAHFRAADRIEHLREFVDAIGLERFSLVMHDWGGAIGTGLAVRQPERIDKIVYFNTTLTETESLPAVIKTAAHPLIGKFLTKTTRYFVRLTTRFGVQNRLSKDVRAGYHFPYRSSSRRTAIWDFVADIPFDSSHPSYTNMIELAEKLPNLKSKPVQIIWGLKDICFHREMLNKVADHFPQARVLEIPEASHLVLEDAPELAIATVQSFLQESIDVDRERARRATGGMEIEDLRNPLLAGFLNAVEERPGESAVMVPRFVGDSVHYSHVTFDGLRALMNKYERGLGELGLRQGDRVLMLVSPGIDFLALAYAVMGRGATPVFLDPGMGKDNLLYCIRQMKPAAMIGSPKAHLLRLIGRDELKTLRFHLTASEWVYLGGPTLNYLKRFSSRAMKPAASPDELLVAFTSGATGVPKGVVFNETMIKAQLKIFNESLGLTAGKRDLPLLPIFSLFHLALGVCSVFPPMNPSKPLTLSPAKILRIVNDLRIDYSFGSPTLWRKIAEYCVRCRTNLKSIERVFMAGAPVSLSTLRRVQEVLPGGVVYTPYGATEALPVTLVSSEDVLMHSDRPARSGEQGTYVGQSVPGIRVRVVHTLPDEPVESDQLRDCLPFEIGEIIVSGDTVSPEYLFNEAATRETKIQDGNSFWHRMGDMGYLDDSGGLYFCGRRAHAVQTESRTYYSVPVEHIFNQHEKVKRSALVSGNGRGDAAVVVEPYPQYWPDSRESRQRFLNELKEIAATAPLTQSIERIYFYKDFPVDARHNAKIFRDKLSELAKKGKLQ